MGRSILRGFGMLLFMGGVLVLVLVLVLVEVCWLDTS